MDKKCDDGMVFCPIKKKCIPIKDQKSQNLGKGKGRGMGKGPIGIPTKEDQIVDDILDGRYSDIKLIERLMDRIDIILSQCKK